MANTSPKAILIKKLIDYLRDEVVELKYINIDLGQLDFFEVRPAVAFPCCMIDIVNIQYDQRQDGQHGNLQIRLRMAFEVMKDTSSLAPDEVLEAGLNYFDIENKVFLKMQYYRAGGLVFNEFIRLRDANEKIGDGFRVISSDYKASFVDRSAG
jgi:hypothetical protein